MDGINLERIRMRLICNWQQAALFKLGISQVARTKVWNLTQKPFHIVSLIRFQVYRSKPLPDR